MKTLIHTRYLNDNQPVCHFPARLDTLESPVIAGFVKDHDTERGCDICLKLMVAANTRAALQQRNISRPGHKVPDYAEYHPNQKSPVRGMIVGFFLVLPFWAAIVALFWILK